MNAARRGLQSTSTDVPIALAWILAFAAAEYLFSMRGMAAIVPGTVLRLISVPLAIFAFALMLRPMREAPLYAAIYTAIGLYREWGAPHLEFSVIRISIEALEMMFIVWALYRYWFHRFADPVVVGAWAIFVLVVTAVGASIMVAAASLLPTDAPDYLHALGGSLGVAWRNWWLGTACSFLALAGPAASLVALRGRLKTLMTGTDRGRFVALTAALAATTLFAFRLADMDWFGFPPDVILAVRLLPVPFAMAMAARFRANGASVAILIFTIIGAYSATVGGGERAWHEAPLPATPRQTLILITTITCMVLSGISRQLHRALHDAVTAGEVKSRFIGLMSHELRTPLNAILGFSELMKMQSLYELGEQVSTLDNIHASGQRLLAMIDALLNHAGEGETIFELRKEPLHLRTAVSGALTELADVASSRSCTVDVEVPDEMFIEADARALRQVLHVLLGHALRLCEDGGATKVSARHAKTDTILEIRSDSVRSESDDELDRVESQLVNALVLAHGARLTVRKSPRGRTARVRFFATRAANHAIA